jgi:uncharacterized membrane protein YsdA (DUF1294 family)
MFMYILIRILTGVYILAVNFYSFMLLRSQKLARDGGDEGIRDIRLYLVAVLGGAIGVYLGMLCMKYRLKNFLLMVLMPLLIASTIYVTILAFMNNFWF